MLIFVQLRGSDTLITKISLFELSQSDLAFMQEGQFKRAFCFMNVIDFSTFKYYLKACYGVTEDALFLVHLLHWFDIEAFNDYELLIEQEKYTKFLGFTSEKVKKIHSRVCPRFGIRVSSYGIEAASDTEYIEELQYHYNADFDLVIRTISFYWEN